MNSNNINTSNLTNISEKKETRTLFYLKNLIAGITLSTSLILTGCKEKPTDYYKPHLIEENGNTKLYKWETKNEGRTIYYVVDNTNVGTQWDITSGKTTNTYNSVYVKGKNNDPAIQTWLNLTPEQQESLGLPRSDNAKIMTLISLSDEQRKNLGLEQDYNNFLSLLKSKK